MPQPLSKVKPNVEEFKFGGIDIEPQLAVLIARVFAMWAMIESALQTMLVRILRADETAATAIYDLLISQAMQTRALEAAAKASMNPDDFERFTVVMTVTEGVQKQRNKLAHWIWGKSADLPETLLLLDPDMVRDQQTNLALLMLDPLSKSKETRKPEK